MKNYIKEWVPYIIIIIVVLLIRTYIITPVKVNGSSMDKTLKEGEIMLLYKLDSIEREDIIVVNKKVEGNSIIKRIIGLPGETIECIDGVIYINDEEYEDKYAYGITSDFNEIKLKDDEYFVLGDNRLVSKDSRYFGPVKFKYIEGTCNVVIFPFSKFGVVE